MEYTAYGAQSKPARSGFELFSWYFFRVSGVLLIFLAIIHLLVMHVTTDVHCTAYAFVAYRYSNPFWRLYDWLLLTLALFHGMNGLRIVIDDYVRTKSLRLACQSLVFLFTMAFFLLGTLSIVTFPFHPTNIGPACV